MGILLRFLEENKSLFLSECAILDPGEILQLKIIQNYFVKIKSIPHGGLFVFIFKGFEQLMLILLWKN